MEKLNETKYTQVGNHHGKHYCDFCGKVCKTEIEWDEREEYRYYTCECKQAQEYVRLNVEIAKLNRKLVGLRKIKNKSVRLMHYNDECLKLKKKYDL